MTISTRARSGTTCGSSRSPASTCICYAPTDHLRVDLSVANLTNQHSYWAHVGHNTDAISDIVDSGMTSLVTAKYVF